MSDKKPDAYVLFCNVKLKPDMEPVRYYIGVAKDLDKKDATPWVYTMDRKRALRFRDNILIGKFLSMYRKEIANISKKRWDGMVYIQDAKTDEIILDSVQMDYFLV